MGEEADGSFQSEVQPSTDVQSLCQYLKRSIIHLLQDEQNSIVLDSVLASKNTQDLLKRFVTDAQVPSILVQRVSTSKESEDDGPEGEERENVQYQVSSEIQYFTGHVEK